jgi:hypothetical protein
MPKNRNMGRASHMALDSQLDSSRPAAEAADMLDQPARPTQHPAQGTKASGEEPLRRHSRRGS